MADQQKPDEQPSAPLISIDPCLHKNCELETEHASGLNPKPEHGGMRQ
ncbi:MAG: hypothetical protein DDT25_00074 [Chloroflexi bacterium]|nr:hypothetical protein [Chloroflexota bacterium]